MKKLILALAYLLLAVPCGARTITLDGVAFYGGFTGIAADKARKYLNKAGNYNIILNK